MKILGIDPGLTGGLAVIEAPSLRVLDAVEIPTVLEGPKRRIDCRWMLDWIFVHAPDVGFIERAQAMPVKGRHGAEGEEAWQGQGASSAFIYGRATGALEAVTLCAGVRLHIVEAGVWKRAAGLIVKGVKRTQTEVKAASLDLARQIFNKDAYLFQMAKSHGRAEAALIARHGWLTTARTDAKQEAKATVERRAPADDDLEAIAEQAAAEHCGEGAAEGGAE